MHMHKILILLTAALAGSVFYKVEHALTAPGTDSVPGGNLYSSLTGEGSLMHTWKMETAARDASLADGSIPKNPRGVPGGGAVAEFAPDDAALLDAASKNDIKKVEARLAAKTKVDSRDDSRRTPLMYASWNGYDDVIVRLLAAGANIDLRDREGNNAFDYAAGRGLEGTLKVLFEHTRTTDDNHYIEYAKTLQATFADDPSKLPDGKGELASINRVNPEGEAPLHIAAGNGSVKMIEALLQRGANVNFANAAQQTALQWAAWNNRADAVALLLKKGANSKLADLAGNTPLILAAQNNSKDAALVLLDNGADKYAVNKQGQTAGIIAEDKGYKDLAALLK